MKKIKALHVYTSSESMLQKADLVVENTALGPEWVLDKDEFFPPASMTLESNIRACFRGLAKVLDAGEKRGVAGLLLGRTERAARAAELQLCAQAR